VADVFSCAATPDAARIKVKPSDSKGVPHLDVDTMALLNSG
jgi:hypothetical protein